MLKDRRKDSNAIQSPPYVPDMVLYLRLLGTQALPCV